MIEILNQAGISALLNKKGRRVKKLELTPGTVARLQTSSGNRYLIEVLTASGKAHLLDSRAMKGKTVDIWGTAEEDQPILYQTTSGPGNTTKIMSIEILS